MDRRLDRSNMVAKKATITDGTRRQAASQKNKKDETLIGRMQRAADSIEAARKEMSEIEALLQDGDADAVSQGARRVRETLDDGQRELRRMIDGDERTQNEQYEDMMSTAGVHMIGACEELRRASKLMAKCCDDDGIVSDAQGVPTMDELEGIAQQMDIWGMCTSHAAATEFDDDNSDDHDGISRRCDDEMDDAFHAYEEHYVELE